MNGPILLLLFAALLLFQDIFSGQAKRYEIELFIDVKKEDRKREKENGREERRQIVGEERMEEEQEGW